MDYYTAAISLMYIAFFEVVAIVWVYGANRLASNVREMTGSLPNIYIRSCWMVASPCLILAIWIFSLIDYEAPTYNNGQYTYPSGAIAMGWGIASLSMIAIPAFAVIALLNAKGDSFMQKFAAAFRSQIRECPCCGRVLNDKHEVHYTETLEGKGEQFRLEQFN